MDISGISGGSTSSTASLASGSLDKNAFLELLVTQLRHQDPLSPVNNENFLAQLAQFASVEQLQSINSGTQTGLLMQQSVGNALSTGLIGKEVELDGSVLKLDGGRSGELAFQLDQPATVSLEIRDGSGTLVRTLEVDGSTLLEPGAHSIQWDGLDENGQALPDGDYQVALKAQDGQGNDLVLSPRVSGVVDGVRFADGIAYLLVAGSEYTLSDVIEVRSASSQES